MPASDRDADARLFEYTTVEEACRTVVLPWVEQWGRQAFFESQPVLLLSADRTIAMLAKRLIAEAGLPTVGLHFILPYDLAAWMPGSRAEEPEAAVLELILATAARDIDHPIARSIANAPGPAFQLLERWVRTGRSLDGLPSAPLRRVAADWEARITQTGWQTPAHKERLWFEQARHSDTPRFAAVLLLGFGAEHWERWCALAAFVRQARSSIVCMPRCSDLIEERLWLGGWEEWLGRPAHSIDTGTGVGFSAVRFFAARSARTVAAALREAMDRRAQQASHRMRVGVLDGARGDVARELAVGFDDERIPYSDGFGRLQGGLPEAGGWQCWLKWEAERDWQIWLDLVESTPVLAEALPPESLTRARQAAVDTGFDRLDWIAVWLVNRPSETDQIIGTALADFPLLPARATLAVMLDTTRRLFRMAGWEWLDDWLGDLVPEAAHGWPVHRRDYLRWLESRLIAPVRTRSDHGGEVFARIELLRPGQGELREWDLLILTGLSEGDWPADPVEAPYLGDAPLQALNETLIRSQGSLVRQGSQGEGHEVLPPEFAWVLTAEGRRRLEQQRLAELPGALEVWYATTLAEETEPEVPVEPGAYFLAAWRRHRDRAFDEEALATMRYETEQLARNRLGREEETVVTAVRTAYSARRDDQLPFGEFECALSRPPETPLQLTPSRWEKLVQSPGDIWFCEGLDLPRASERFDYGVRTGRTLGSWRHRFAAAIAPERAKPVPLPEDVAALEAVDRRAGRMREEAARALASLDARLPIAWVSFWEEALAQARRGMVAALELARARGARWIATEWPLPETALDEDQLLRVRGNLDLIAARDWPEPGPRGELLCFDYKTWKNNKGEPLPPGLQLFLYGRALERRTGIVPTVLAVLVDGECLEIPRAFANRPPAELLEALTAIARNARLGILEPRSWQYSIPPVLPIAVLRIGAAVLLRKWERTHPNLVKGTP